MSVSTPRPKNSRNPAARSLLPKKPGAIGWSLSALLHLGVWLALALFSLYLPPLRPHALPNPPDRSAGSAQNGVSPADRRAAETPRHVAELLRTQQEMEQLRDRRQEQYHTWIRQRAADAPRETLQALQTATQAQRQAAAAQAEALRIQQQQTQIKGQATEATLRQTQEAQKAVERTRNAQAKALQAQNEAVASLELAHPADPQVRQALAEAQRKMVQAQEAQNRAASIQEQAAQVEPKTREARTETERLRKAYEAIKNDPQAAQRTLDQFNQTGARHVDLSLLLAKLRQEAPPAQAAAQQVQADALQAQQQAQELASRQIPLPLQANTPPRPHQGGQEHGPEGNGGSGPLGSHDYGPESHQPGHGTATGNPGAANIQAGGESAARGRTPGQETGNPRTELSQYPIPNTQHPNKVAPSVQSKSSYPTEAKEVAPSVQSKSSYPTEDFTPTPHHSITPSLHHSIRMDGRSLPELYADAVASERHSAEAYRQIRAIDRAMIEGMPLERAMQETEYTPPLRPELSPARSFHLFDIPGPPTSEPNETETAQQQIAAMNTLGHHLLSRVQAEHNGARGATVSLDWVKGRAAQSARRQALAQEDGQQAKDLTAGLRGVSGGATGAHYGSAQAKDRQTQSTPTSLPPPIPAGLDIKSIPGRKILPGASASAWMFVDSWYTVGPFPNPRRANIDRSFPPEQGIDLDAAYLGKDNRTIHWKFVQSGGPMVVPADPEEYGIYYAYTELWFDRPRDLWIAVGSDDKSTLWIEDQLVWISSNELKGWRIDEGLRKVHFKQGLNRIVYRLENGWRGMGLSLVICLKSTP